jgi:hypothetical protein
MFGVPAAAAPAGTTRPTAAQTHATVSTNVFLTVANEWLFGANPTFL